MIATIDATRITDWDSFHSVFAETLGFPDFYGCNMNAWIDCLTYIDDPGDRMTAFRVEPGQCLTLSIEGATEFAARCPEQFSALVDCTAFVNYRRIESGEPALLALAYFRVV